MLLEDAVKVMGISSTWRFKRVEVSRLNGKRTIEYRERASVFVNAEIPRASTRYGQKILSTAVKGTLNAATRDGIVGAGNRDTVYGDRSIY